MKKLLSFILLLSALFVGCIFPTLGAFAMSGMESEAHQNMDHNMWDDMMMPCDSGDDSTHMHECCESPFIDSLASRVHYYSSYWDNWGTWETSEVDVLYALHENITAYSLDKLHSPPWNWCLPYDSQGNIYMELIGIIKNNS